MSIINTGQSRKLMHKTLTLLIPPSHLMTPPLLLSRRRLLFLAVGSISAFSLYKLYTKRRIISDFLQSLASISESLALVSSDLNHFLKSDSDEIPNSLIQISKLLKSDEVFQSFSRFSEALTVGIVKGSITTGTSSSTDNKLIDRVLEKLFSESGSGFASIVVGSFARNLVVGYKESGSSDGDSGWGWINLLVGDEKCKELIGKCIEVFVKTAVAVYLEKTMEINAYDEFFSGITNAKHEEKIKELLVTVCNGAVETLVRTSHQVLNNSSLGESSSDSVNNFDLVRKIGKSNVGNEKSGWFDQVQSTLAVPSNRRFVLDVTGRVTFETVRSFLEFMMRKLYDGAKRSVHVVNEGVVERGLDVVRYCSAKTMLVVTICLALCMRVLAGTRVLMPV